MPSTHTGSLVIPASESETVEFKEKLSKPEQIAMAVCAFLNSNGGTVYLGVRDREKIIGLDDATMVATELQKQLQMRISPKALWSVNVEDFEDKKIVTVEVPAGNERPYVCDGGIYLRKGDRSISANAESIHRMVELQYRTPFRWERQPAAGFEIEDLDDKEVKKAVGEIRQRGRFQLEASASTSDVLYHLSLMQSGVLTNACAVLFGKNPARTLPQSRVRATVFSTDKGGDFLDDHVFEGHAFSLLNQVTEFLQRNVRLVAEFEPGKMQRTDRPEYPFGALREGVMNALAHRDFASFDGGMTVGVYPDRIEVWNSGALPDRLTVGALKRPHPSLPPNPDIAHVFYLRGFIERIGRGTIKILDECKSANLPAPSWKTGESGVTLTIHGRRGGAVAPKLNRRQKDLLASLKPGQSVAPGEYYARLAGVVSQRQAQRDLSCLEDAGWLQQEGSGPATVYIRTDKGAE